MLTGTWIAQGAEFAGESIPLPPTRWLITGDHYVVEGPAGRDEGRLVLNLAVTPPHLDLVGTRGPNAGRTIPAIFRMRGNLLQLCYGVGASEVTQPRPSTLTTAPGVAQMLIRYRREA